NGGDNGNADVMLIQTFFHYLRSQTPGYRGLNGLRNREIPEITTICDTKTKRAIFKFQQFHARHLLSIDGLIHPAKYKGRVLKNTKRFMTITLLHLLAEEINQLNNGSHYIDRLIEIEPRLRQWLV
ncbi:MAG: hypothetical protein ACT4O9_04820, partial [Blastocatellia bacterium]